MGTEHVRILESADELHRMREQLDRISQTLWEAGTSKVSLKAGETRLLGAARIREIVHARRYREQLFSPELFSDPAWDMMLELMAARLEGQRVAVSTLVIAAAVPPTTALRWIKTLCDQGFFVRTADPEDTRRVYIELSDEVAKRLETYFARFGGSNLAGV